MPIDISSIIEFQIQSSMDLPADGFSIRTVGTAAFRSAGIHDQIDLSVGFRDVTTGLDYFIKQIEKGLIDSYDIEADTSSMVTTILGRDVISELLDRHVEVIYTTAFTNLPVAQFSPDIPSSLPGGETEAINVRLVTTDPIHYIPVIRIQKASQIARDIAKRAGLDLVWQCRDYTMKVDFNGVGKALELIRQLVEPWNILEVLKTDIFVQGTTIFVRQRQLSPSADYTFTIPDARIKALTVTRHPHPVFGRVTLEGSESASGMTTSLNVSGGEDRDSTTTEVVRVVKTFDPNTGQLLSVTTITETKRGVDGALLEYLEESVSPAGSLVKRERRTNKWDDISYGPNGAINQPKPLGSLIVIESIYRKTFLFGVGNVFDVTEKQILSYAYDTNNYLEIQSLDKYSLDKKTETLVLSQREIKRYVELNPTRTMETTTQWDISKKTGLLTLVSVDSHTSQGKRPGGPQPPFSVFVPADAAPTNQRRVVRLVKVITDIKTNPRAVDISYSNANLSSDDLQFLFNQINSVNGGWLYEINLTCLSIPWLRKGSVIQLNNFVVEDGVTTFALLPALITNNNIIVRQGKEVISEITAVFWRAT